MQGITIGPLVRYLDVKKTNKKESINEEIHVRVSFFCISCWCPTKGVPTALDRGRHVVALDLDAECF